MGELPEETFAKVARCVPVGVALIRDERFVWVNDTFCEVSGHSKETVVGRSVYSLLTPGEVERVRTRHVQRRRGEPVPENYEVDIHRADGVQARVELTSRVLPDGDTLLLVRGLGDRLRDLALLGELGQLAATVQRARTVMDCARTAAEGLLALGMTAGILRLEGNGAHPIAHAMAPEVEEVLRRSMGRSPPEMVLPIDRLPNLSLAVRERRPVFIDDALQAIRNLAGAGGIPLAADIAEVARDAGMEQMVDIPLMVAGECWGVLIVIGRRLQTNDAAALGLFGAQLGSAIEAAHTIEHLEKHNRRLEAVHGLAVTATEDGLRSVTGRLLDAILADTQSESAICYLRAGGGEGFDLMDARGAGDSLRELYRHLPEEVEQSLFAGGQPRPRRIPFAQIVSPARELLGEYGIAEVAMVPLRVGEQVTGVVFLGRTRAVPYGTAVLRDAETLGALAALQLERTRLFEELRQSYEQLSLAQQELVKRERLAALGELSAVVAHEVRNPLGAILNSVSALRRMVPEAKDPRALLDIVEEESERLERMVSDLLDFARPNPPTLRELPLELLVMGAVESTLRCEADARQVRIRCELSGGPQMVKVDAQMFRQAMVNLLTNAVQASPEGGTVVIKARHDTLRGRPCVAVEVCDEGPGVPQALVEKIFQPFFTTRAAGTGLGLAVVKGIAEAHRGEVLVQSAPGRGTTFRLLLPL